MIESNGQEVQIRRCFGDQHDSQTAKDVDSNKTMMIHHQAGVFLQTTIQMQKQSKKTMTVQNQMKGQFG